MEFKDIRWEQRFSNYQKVLFHLNKFIDKGKLSELEKQGLIKSFEYTYELAWNTIKDFLEYQGITDIIGSRDTFREAFKVGIITDAETWIDMLKSRNRTSHTYNEEIANEICNSIVDKYFSLFVSLKDKIKQHQRNSEQTIFDKD